jgi:hypothetical protein
VGAVMRGSPQGVQVRARAGRSGRPG